MQRLRTRTELIQFAEARCGSYACRRAFLTGKVMVFGGFSTIPPGTDPGWILRVKSRHGRAWLLAVVTDDIKHCYCVREIEKIPWAKWTGCAGRGQGYSIYDGDMPVQAARAYKEAKWCE